jgi:hypothetical protein
VTAVIAAARPPAVRGRLNAAADCRARTRATTRCQGQASAGGGEQKPAGDRQDAEEAGGGGGEVGRMPAVVRKPTMWTFMALIAAAWATNEVELPEGADVRPAHQ